MKTTQKGKSKPLTTEIVDGELRISIGVNVLAFATMFYLRNTGTLEKEIGRITCPEGFAMEMARELEREEEDGTTKIAELFDTAASDAINNGSQYINLLHKGKVHIAGYCRLRKEDK